MTRTLLLFGARHPQLHALEAARRLGCRVVALDPCSDAPGAKLADAFYAHDLADVEACLAVARKHDVDGVLTIAADYPIPAMAEICAALGLSGISREAAHAATNKAAMRKKLRDGGLPMPQSILTTSAAGARQACRELGGGVLIKPTDSSGGRGVTSLEPTASDASIEHAFQTAVGFSRMGGVVVEELIEGPEYSVEGITYRGRTEIVAITDKLTTGSPYFVEVGHSLPTLLGPGDQAALEAVAQQAVAAIGIDDAASHVEIIISAGGPRVVEVGARLGGGFIASHLVPLSTGVDLVQAAVRVCLGEAPVERRDRRRGAAIRFLVPRPGRVRAIHGLQAARDLDGVQAVDLSIGVGDRVEPLRNAMQRVGHVIAEAGDARQARRLARRACSLIEIDTVDEFREAL